MGNAGIGVATKKNSKYGGGIPRESTIPVGVRQNPYANMEIKPVNAGQLGLHQEIKGHDAAISA